MAAGKTLLVCSLAMVVASVWTSVPNSALLNEIGDAGTPTKLTMTRAQFAKRCSVAQLETKAGLLPMSRVADQVRAQCTCLERRLVGRVSLKALSTRQMAFLIGSDAASVDAPGPASQPPHATLQAARSYCRTVT